MLIARDGTAEAVKKPSREQIALLPGTLCRGRAILIPERVEEDLVGGWYAQALPRDDNTYQLEQRDGTPTEQYQTRTVSQERVLTALLGWTTGAENWKTAFLWNNIGSYFTSPQEQQ